MIRALASAGLLVVLAALSGCEQFNWQGGYDEMARGDCRENLDAEARRACLDQVERNASEKRADKRG